MTPSPETLAAYADGELAGAERTAVEQAIAADPALAAQVEAHRALRARLAAHFAPILDAPVPDELTRLAQGSPADNVIDLAAAAAARRRASRPRWGGPFTGFAIAASLAVVVVAAGLGQRLSAGYAHGDLAAALDSQVSGAPDSAAPVRVLLSVRDGQGRYCRGFTKAAEAGIACRDSWGWKLGKRAGVQPGEPATDYRQAGSAAPAVLEALQAMARGPALSAEEERQARQHGWRELGGRLFISSRKRGSLPGQPLIPRAAGS